MKPKTIKVTEELQGPDFETVRKRALRARQAEAPMTLREILEMTAAMIMKLPDNKIGPATEGFVRAATTLPVESSPLSPEQKVKADKLIESIQHPQGKMTEEPKKEKYVPKKKCPRFDDESHPWANHPWKEEFRKYVLDNRARGHNMSFATAWERFLAFKAEQEAQNQLPLTEAPVVTPEPAPEPAPAPVDVKPKEVPKKVAKHISREEIYGGKEVPKKVAKHIRRVWNYHNSPYVSAPAFEALVRQFRAYVPSNNCALICAFIRDQVQSNDNVALELARKVFEHDLQCPEAAAIINAFGKKNSEGHGGKALSSAQYEEFKWQISSYRRSRKS